jgi:hypothetical protein
VIASLKGRLMIALTPKRVFFVAGCCLLSLLPVSASADEALRQRFLSEYPAASEKIEAYYQGVSMRVRETIAWKDESKPDLVYEHDYKSTDDKALLLTRTITEPESMAGGPQSQAVVANARLSFAVQQPKSSESWVLRDIRQFVAAEGAISLNARGTVAPYVFNGMKIVNLIRKPDFKIVDATWEAGGKRLAKVHFDWPDEKYETGGWFLFSPDESWILYSFQVHSNDKGSTDVGHLHADITYQPSDGKLPWLKRAHYWMELHHGNKTDPPGSFNTFEVIEISRKAVPNSEFTLASFGIAEPSETPQSRQRLVWVAMIVGVFMLAFAVFWLTRRRNVGPRPT